MALAHVGRPTESWPGPTRREDGEPVQILRGDATAMIPTIRRHRIRTTPRPWDDLRCTAPREMKGRQRVRETVRKVGR